MTMPSRSSSAMSPPLRHRHHGDLMQGPRPAPLKVNNSTGGGTMTTTTTTAVNKRRRPHHHQHHHAPPPRQPVIIYVESPRVVHAHPGEFKSVVQRLTGAPAPASSAPPPLPLPLPLQFPFQFPFPVVGAAAGSSAGDPSTVMSVTLADTTAGGSSPVHVHHQQLANHHLLVARSHEPYLPACYQHNGGTGDLLFVDRHY